MIYKTQMIFEDKKKKIYVQDNSHGRTKLC